MYLLIDEEFDIALKLVDYIEHSLNWFYCISLAWYYNEYASSHILSFACEIKFEMFVDGNQEYDILEKWFQHQFSDLMKWRIKGMKSRVQ